jgi:hypothetical protein
VAEAGESSPGQPSEQNDAEGAEDRNGIHR